MSRTFNYTFKSVIKRNACRRSLIAAFVHVIALLAFAPAAEAQLTLTWKDNSSNEDGFAVERSVDGVNFDQIGEAPANQTTFLDPSAAEGVTYYYRVRAFNAYGFSGYTNISDGLLPLIENALKTITNAISGLVGSMSKTGESIYDATTGVYQISASGVGYETYNDALRFEYVQASGDIRFVARVHDFAPDNSWARAGIMIRSSLATNARHASMLINGDGSFETLIRATDGGAVASKKGANGTTGYLAVDKTGNTIKLSYSANGSSWTTLSTVAIDFGSAFLVGLAIGSQTDGYLSGAVMEVVEAVNVPFTTSDARAPSASATSAIIGSMSKEGANVYDETTGTYQISASGVGYETYDDALRYTYVNASGDLRFVARLHDFAADNAWARAGVMIRSSLNPNARHASMAINGDGNFETLIRNADGAAVSVKKGGSGSKGFLAIDKTGNALKLSYSTNGTSWTTLSSVNIDFGSSFLIGLAIGSQSDGALSGSVFEIIETTNVSFGASAGGSATPTFSDFSSTSAIIGSMSNAGTHSFDPATGIYKISASGVGYESVSDELRFSYVSKSGDTDMIIKVADFAPDGNWARAGIMIRQSLDPKSKHASIVVNGKGLAESLVRSKAGGSVVAKSGPTFAANGQLRLKKAGSAITLSYSANGSSWTTVNSVTLSLAEPYLIGLAIGSEVEGKLSSATIETLQKP